MGSGPEDLKPENVFLSATGYVKLVEFSLAKVVHARQDGGVKRMIARGYRCGFLSRSITLW